MYLRIKREHAEEDIKISGAPLLSFNELLDFWWRTQRY